MSDMLVADSKNTPQEENTDSGRTFTQDEVNRIVKERLAKEREKLKREQDALFAEREQKIAQKELRMSAIEKLQEKGLPASLADAINCSSDESIDKSIEVLKQAGEARSVEAPYTPNRGDSVADDPIRRAMGI